MSARPSSFVALGAALLASGCGAVTLRVSAGPELGPKGDAGFDAMLDVGIGTPLDFTGRSHHFLQAHGSLGGGGTGKPLSGQFTALGGVDYIYWAEPRLVMRTGFLFAYRSVWDAPVASDLGGFGGHLALLPVVKPLGGGPMAALFAMGPDIRILALASYGTSPGGPTFAVPLVAELDVFAAGD